MLNFFFAHNWLDKKRFESFKCNFCLSWNPFLFDSTFGVFFYNLKRTSTHTHTSSKYPFSLLLLSEKHAATCKWICSISAPSEAEHSPDSPLPWPAHRAKSTNSPLGKPTKLPISLSGPVMTKRGDGGPFVIFMALQKHQEQVRYSSRIDRRQPVKSSAEIL